MNIDSRTRLAASAAIIFLLAVGACSTERTYTARDSESTTYGYSNYDSAGRQTSQDANRLVVRHPPGSAAVIQLEEQAPRQVVAGRDINYEFRVTNLTDAMLSGVVVTNKPAPGFRVNSAEPEAQSSEGMMVWNIGDLNARESRSIRFNGRSEATGPLENCASVTYTPGAMACTTVQVIQPELSLSSNVAERFSRCDPIPFRVTVQNTGVGPANDVMIRLELPEGLIGPDGRRVVEQTVGTLAQGESRTVTFNLRAERSGTYDLVANAQTPDGLTSATEASIVVGEPVLEVKINGPTQDFINVDIPYEVTVTNTGDYPAVNTMLQASSDARGATIVAVDSGRGAGSTNQWSLGTIEPGQSRNVRITMRGTSPGTVQAAFTATAQCARQAVASAQTQLRGIPALLLEVVDERDPVRIGDTTVYVISVVNQGSETATNIRITCALEEAIRLTAAEGVTNSTASPGAATIAFEPLQRLAPGERAVWRVTVEGVQEADTRFAVSMTSDELERPVEETESTHIYNASSPQ